MALAIDPTTPALATGNQTATTASFTPPAGSLLLVAFSGNDDDWPQFPTVPTITDNLGSHLTYTIWDWQCGGAAGASASSRPSTGHEGQTAFWTANVITSAAMTISVTNNTTLGQSQCAVRVWVITGADAADPVGAHGFNGSTSASSVSQSYTAQIDNGQGFLAVCDWTAVGTETAGTGCTLDDAGSLGAPDVSYGFTHRTVADDANGGLTTLNMSLPSSSSSLNWSYIEIQPGASDPPEKDPPPFINFYAPGGIAPNGIPSPWLGTANAAPAATGVIIDGSSPATVLNTAGTATGLTTASFTPPANSLLLILWSGNSIDPTNPSTPTITDSLGSPLTYTLSDWQSHADAPTTDGQAAAWTAPVTSAAAMTVTVNNNAASPNRHAALTVLVLTDPNGRPRAGAHGKSGSTSASVITQSYTAQATGGQGFFSLCDWNAVGNPVAGTDCYAALPSSTGPGSVGTIPTQISYGHFKRTVADDVNTVSNRLNVSLPASSAALNWVYIEILPASTSIPWTLPQYPTGRSAGATPWLQRDLRDANTVGTPANPLPAPLDSAWQADGPYWHLYNDRPARPWTTSQRAYVSDPSLLAPAVAGIPAAPARTVQPRDLGAAPWIQRRTTDVTLLATAELENELLGSADTLKRYLEPATHGPRWWMPEQKPVGASIDAAPAGNIAFDTTGSTSVLAGTTSTTVDITAAAVGAWCYCWVALGVNSGAVTATGWTSLLDSDEGAAAHYALLRRQKQGGDTTFTFSWTTSTKGTLAWASWTGLDSVTPDEQATLATNGVTGRTAVPTPSATPTAANRWAVGFFGVRTTNVANKPVSWTPDAAETERIDVDNNAAGSAPWVGVEIADTATAVTQAAHSYTATHNASESHDGSAILFLIPGAAAATSIPFSAQRTVQIRDLGEVQWLQRRANLQLTDALLENELLGGAGTAQRANTPASAPRWWMPQQPKRDGTTPGLLDSALLENELLGSGTTAERAGTAASNAPRTWTPLQPKRDASTPGLLDSAQLEAPLLGVDRHATWYTDRRAQPPQRGPAAQVDAPIAVDPLTVAFGAGGIYWHLYNTATDQVSRAWFPKQRDYRSDPSFYPTIAPTDPLTLAWGAGGTYWLLYNVAALTVDRREVPQQRLYISDPGLLLTALLEIPPARGQGPITDRRYPPTQVRALSQPDVAAADVPAADLRARLAPTTNAERRSLIVQPPRRTLYFDAGPGTPPLTLSWGAGGSYWHRYNDWRRDRTWTPPTGSPGILCACHVTRPDTGTTTRPSTGTTVYLLATTARPAGGTTIRPDTGITGDPCC